MQTYQRLSVLAAVTASFLLSSTVSFAHGHHHKQHHHHNAIEHKVAVHEANFKGEAVEPCPAVLTLSDGFYLGGAAGYDSYRVGKTTTIVDQDSDSITASRKLSMNGWVGGIFGGYGRYFDRFYLGGEGFWYGANANSSFSAYAATSPGSEVVGHNGTQKVTQEYGLAILPGYKLSESSLIYIKLGYNWAKFKGTEQIISTASNVQNTSFTHTQGGFGYGVGTELAVVPHVSVRAEFDHTNYRSFSTAAPFNTSYQNSDNQFMLGLVYHFGDFA